jgi:hypothetical protein
MNNVAESSKKVVDVVTFQLQCAADGHAVLAVPAANDSAAPVSNCTVVNRRLWNVGVALTVSPIPTLTCEVVK